MSHKNKLHLKCCRYIIYNKLICIYFIIILEYIKNLGQHVATIERPFDLSTTVGISKQCQKDSRQFIETLKKLELWALKSKNFVKF